LTNTWSPISSVRAGRDFELLDDEGENEQPAHEDRRDPGDALRQRFPFFFLRHAFRGVLRLGFSIGQGVLFLFLQGFWHQRTMWNMRFQRVLEKK
jgi:hypothetical protein